MCIFCTEDLKYYFFISSYEEKHLCLSSVAFMWGLAEEQVAWVNLSAQNKMALVSADTSLQTKVILFHCHNHRDKGLHCP